MDRPKGHSLSCHKVCGRGTGWLKPCAPASGQCWSFFKATGQRRQQAEGVSAFPARATENPVTAIVFPVSRLGFSVSRPGIPGSRPALSRRLACSACLPEARPVGRAYGFGNTGHRTSGAAWPCGASHQRGGRARKSPIPLHKGRHGALKEVW